MLERIGLTVLALSVVRLGWRLTHRVPPLPDAMPAWEKLAARATHWAFYALIILMPLSGWLYVSTGWSYHDDRPLVVATHWFGLFHVPALFGLTHADEGLRRTLAFLALRTHLVLAWTTVALAALHVAAALKHQMVNRDEVLAHMVPGVEPAGVAPAPSSAGRNVVLGVGLSLVTVAMCAAFYALANLAPPAAPASVETAPTENVSTAPSVAGPAPTQTTTVAATTSAVAATAPAAAPSAWTVNQGASAIRFAVTYSDEEGSNRINGRFARWRADIRFAPDNLAQSSAVVTIDMASASTGVQQNDDSMKGEAWLNTAGQPSATFRSTSIRHLSGANYEARGSLTIKGHAVPVTMPFTLAINGNQARMDGHVTLSRERFDIGARDPEGNDRISANVDVTVHVEANRAS